ncbi:MAG: PilT/PilU family type 4a pilus ATPase [Candidatus Acidiferrales bacterium]
MDNPKSPGESPKQQAVQPPGPVHRMLPTPELIRQMLEIAKSTSDVIFSPGRAPMAEVNGQLLQLNLPGINVLTSEDTARIAADVIGGNQEFVRKLREEGSCDLSYAVAKLCRFRVNIFTQRGSCAIVMRVIPNTIPDLKALNLPPQLAEIADLRNGIVLVTGPSGSGKSSTLAAIVDSINEHKACHILTIEDPIEFLHPHKRAAIHQRELYSDTPSFAAALRAALRQAPKVILVGEMRDRETIETALEAAETGILVLSTLHTIDAAKTVERIVGAFPLNEQMTIRSRLARMFRFIVAQRLIPKIDGSGRIAAVEILKSTMRTRDYVAKGESDSRSIVDAMRAGDNEGMQTFDMVIEQLIRDGKIDFPTGISYATNPNNLKVQLGDLAEPRLEEPELPTNTAEPDVVTTEK